MSDEKRCPSCGGPLILPRGPAVPAVCLSGCAGPRTTPDPTPTPSAPSPATWRCDDCGQGYPCECRIMDESTRPAAPAPREELEAMQQRSDDAQTRFADIRERHGIPAPRDLCSKCGRGIGYWTAPDESPCRCHEAPVCAVCQHHEESADATGTCEVCRLCAALTVERAARERAVRALEEQHDATDQLHNERTALRAELARLRAALEEYGRHAKVCGFWSDADERDCSCGLRRALDAGGGGA